MSFIRIATIVLFTLLAVSASADDLCADCYSQCDTQYETTLDWCHATNQQCLADCDENPWPGCWTGCNEMHIACIDQAGFARAICKGDCVWYPCCLGNPCDDGLFCNGLETCAETVNECLPGEPPFVCPDDESYCNGPEECSEEYQDCRSTGNPCPEGEVCFEDGRQCLSPHTCDGCNDICQARWDIDNDWCDHDYNQCLEDCAGNPDCQYICGENQYGCLEMAYFAYNDCVDLCDWHPCCEGDPCDDGVFCNGAETCAEEPGECQDSEPVDCDDNLFCTGVEYCDKEADECVSTGDPCPDDLLFCTGTESCNEEQDACEATGNPCPEDLLFCNGFEFCNEGQDICATTGNPCPDDALFCTGVESCDEDADQCASTGDPCAENEICEEDADRCEPTGDDDDDSGDDDDDDTGDDDSGDDDSGDDDDDDACGHFGWPHYLTGRSPDEHFA